MTGQNGPEKGEKSAGKHGCEHRGTVFFRQASRAAGALWTGEPCACGGSVRGEGGGACWPLLVCAVTQQNGGKARSYRCVLSPESVCGVIRECAWPGACYPSSLPVWGKGKPSAGAGAGFPSPKPPSLPQRAFIGGRAWDTRNLSPKGTRSVYGVFVLSIEIICKIRC